MVGRVNGIRFPSLVVILAHSIPWDRLAGVGT